MSAYNYQSFSQHLTSQPDLKLADSSANPPLFSLNHFSHIHQSGPPPPAHLLGLIAPPAESSGRPEENQQYFLHGMSSGSTYPPQPNLYPPRLHLASLQRPPMLQKPPPPNQHQPQPYGNQLPPMFASSIQMPLEPIPQHFPYNPYSSINYTPYINSNPSSYQNVPPFGANQQFQNHYVKPPYPGINNVQKLKVDYENQDESSTSISHFKPTKTKKNSKPRINKIQTVDSTNKKLDSKIRNKLSGTIGEPSVEDLYIHFQQILKIDIPKDRGIAFYHLKMKNDLECQLFDLYVHNLSSSFDVFLSQEVFQKVVPVLALYDETNMIIDSIFCLSSLMLQRIRPDKIEPSIPIKYYHQCIKSIRHYLSMPEVEHNEGIISRCLLSTILLCIYEMFFVAIDSTYVKGASSILLSILAKQPKKNLLKESPFHEVCFLGIFVCDLILSLKFNIPSMYSIETFWKPLDPEYFESFDQYHPHPVGIENGKDEEVLVNNGILPKQCKLWWLQKTVMNLSIINDFNNGIQVITRADFETNKPFHKWLELRTMLHEYEVNLPSALKPVIYISSGPGKIFPTIYFCDEITAIIGLNFKLLKLALYEALILRNDTSDATVLQEIKKYPPNYCKKLCKDIIGIMRTYDGNTNVWSNNIHTVRQVARYIADESEAFDEFIVLVNRIIGVCHLKLQDTII